MFWPRESQARLVHLVRPRPGRPAAEQLAKRVREMRASMVLSRADRSVLLAQLHAGTARPQLAEPRGARGDAQGVAVLARPRGRRLPCRRGAPSDEGSAVARQPGRATTQPAARGASATTAAQPRPARDPGDPHRVATGPGLLRRPAGAR